MIARGEIRVSQQPVKGHSVFLARMVVTVEATQVAVAWCCDGRHQAAGWQLDVRQGVHRVEKSDGAFRASMLAAIPLPTLCIRLEQVLFSLCIPSA